MKICIHKQSAKRSVAWLVLVFWLKSRHAKTLRNRSV